MRSITCIGALARPRLAPFTHSIKTTRFSPSPVSHFSARAISIFTSRRPQFNPTLATSSPTSSLPAVATPSVGGPDVLPKISAHPSLASIQVRNGPRDTMANWTHRVRKRRHGYLSRLKTHKGKQTLKRRQLKKRRSLSH